MPSRKTCDKCKHYTPTDLGTLEKYKHAGSCALMMDSNDHPTYVDADKVSGWDYEGYRAGCFVGPKFGCIHWVKVQ